MSDLGEFEERVKARLTVAQQRRKAFEEHTQQRAQELVKRSQQFQEAADHLLQSVFRPRIEKVTGFLSNGRVLSGPAVSRYECACRFEPVGRFPSTTRLSLGVSHDGRFEQLILLYDLEILPVPFGFEASDQCQFSAHAIEEARAIRWADEQLLRFVDIFLRVKDNDLPPEETIAEKRKLAA
jgi:hypothetical protein